MNLQNICTYKNAAWVPALFILFVLVYVAIAHGADQWLVQPREEGLAKSKAMVISQYQPYELRKGQITITPQIIPESFTAAASRAAVGDSETNAFLVSFFADVNYEVILDSVNTQTDGTKIISGKIKDHNLRTFTMTIAPDGFIITLQDMNRQVLYRAVGNTLSGSGTVTEIDMKKIPPMIR
jgi:sugar diacid utilization regulator